MSNALGILFPSADSESEGITTPSESPDGVESASSVLGSIAGFELIEDASQWCERSGGRQTAYYRLITGSIGKELTCWCVRVV